MSFKKMDRVRVKNITGSFNGEVGTVVAVSLWVFGYPEDVCYLVDLDSGQSVTCDAQDLELTNEDDE